MKQCEELNKAFIHPFNDEKVIEGQATVGLEIIDQTKTHPIHYVFVPIGGGGLSAGMFSIKYQLFLNDIYYLGSTELLTYSMTKSYLEDLDWLLSTQKQIRYNQREDRLYIDIDWAQAMGAFQNP